MDTVATQHAITEGRVHTSPTGAYVFYEGGTVMLEGWMQFHADGTITGRGQYGMVISDFYIVGDTVYIPQEADYLDKIGYMDDVTGPYRVKEWSKLLLTATPDSLPLAPSNYPKGKALKSSYIYMDFGKPIVIPVLSR